MGFATQFQRDKTGNWQGVDGDPHPNDVADLETLRKVSGAELIALMKQRIPKPQTLGDIVAAKDRLKRIRDLKEILDALEGQ